MLAGLLFFFYPDQSRDWGFYIALGVLGYAVVLAVYGPQFFFRLRNSPRP